MQPAGRNASTGPWACPSRSQPGESQHRDLRHHLALPQRRSGSSTRAISTAGVGPTPRPSAGYVAENIEALWQRTQLYHADALPVEPARGVPRRDDLAERDPPRPDLLLVGRRLLRRLRGELRLLPVELHARLELRPEPRPALSRGRAEHADLQLHHLPAPPTARPRTASTPHTARSPTGTAPASRRPTASTSSARTAGFLDKDLARREEGRRLADREPSIADREGVPARASAEHLRHVGLRRQHVHRLAVSLRAGGRPSGWPW